MKFDWDRKKNAANLRKHGISFQEPSLFLLTSIELKRWMIVMIMGQSDGSLSVSTAGCFSPLCIPCVAKLSTCTG
jgi:hypothetical protein